MQHKFGFLAILAFALLGSSAARAQQVLAWWDFQDLSGPTASDVSGNGWNGALTDFHDTSANAGGTIGGSGWSNTGALNFDGRSLDNTPNGDTVRTQLPIGSLSGKSFTVEALVSHNFAQTNWSPFFGQSDGACCPHIFFFGRTDNTGTPNVVAPLHFNIAGLGAGNSALVPIADGEQHHIALTFNDVTDTIDVFFDYNNVGNFTGITGTLDTFAPNFMWLGGVGHNNSERWNGYAWEARVIVDEPGLPGSGVLPVGLFLAPDPNGIPAPTPQGSSFDFANFGDASRFMMRGTAGKHDMGTLGDATDDRIRLTTSTHGGQAGSAFLNGTVHFPQANLAFSTKFAVELSTPVGCCDADGAGADGMTFVIQAASPKALGWAGGGMGLQDIGQYVAVELDTWNGGVHDFAPTNGTHIAIDLNTSATSIAQDPPSNMPGLPRFNDGGVKYVWVDYDGTEMKVYYNTVDVKPASPNVTAIVDLSAHFGGAQDLFVGFTAGTGGALNNHDIVSWQFAAVPEPSTYALAGLGIVGLAWAKRRRRK
ncbi:MAG: hypothetical protein DCC68_03895 [Planctomycetota bacterium]|nr:MAG: hypothetical protein DCC68_03895 [Planctomycetota bacterium]